MAKRTKHHTAEFKVQAVRMARASTEPIAKIAKELGVSTSVLYGWLKKSDPSSQPIPENESELARVKRELEIVRMERDFLKKAAAFFAKNQQ
jgi:transposase-like protein